MASMPVDAPAPPTRARDHASLRILDVTKFYSSASGGVRTYLDAKIRHFATTPGVEHALVIPADRDSLSIEGRTRIHRVAGPVIRMSPHYRLLVSLSALRRIIEIERPDVIEVGSPFLVPWLVMRAIRGKEIRTAGFYHSDLVRTYAEPLVPGRASAPVRVVTTNFARAYVRNLHRRFDLTVAASPAVSAELRALGVADVHCIPLGVDVEVFRPVDGDRGWLRTRLRVPEGRPIALFAGRFCAEKRLDVVIDATSRLPANRRPHLVFIGAGPNEAMLHGMARARGDMSILPFIRERTELARAYRGADVYLASGPGETFGLAIAEAMACGLPVVAVNRGASPDRVRGSNAATLYRDGSVDECADAIRRMLERLSPELRAAAAGHVAATCSWSLTFEKLLQLYRELVARARA